MPATPSIARKRLDIGSGDTLEVVEITGAGATPVVSVLGGIHGDEEEGVLAVRRIVNHLSRRQDLKGTVRCVPISSEAAYRARSRTSPVDGRNMARVFPGDRDGTLTERTAYAITTEVVTGSDVLIDLHSAGLNYSMPLFCGYFDVGDACSEAAYRFGRLFGAPLLWAHTQPTEGRTLSAALALGVPAVYAEASGGGEVRAADVNTFINGVLNILAFKGMLDGKPSGLTEQRFIKDAGGNIEDAPAAPATGTAVTYVKAGDEIGSGDVIAEVFDDNGRAIGKVSAPHDGLIMCLRRTARVEKGDTIAMVARPAEVLAALPSAE